MDCDGISGTGESKIWDIKGDVLNKGLSRIPGCPPGVETVSSFSVSGISLEIPIRGLFL